MPLEPIDELPPYPDRLQDSETVFVTKVTTYMAAQQAMVSQLNAMIDYLNSLSAGGNANGFALETIAVSAGDEQITCAEYDNLNKKLVLINGHPQVSGYSGPDSTHIDFDEPLPDGVVTLVTLATY